MKTETFKGEIGSAYGEKLPKPLPFNGTFQAFENVEELRAANKFPSDEDIVGYVNADVKNNERQKAMTAALDAAGYKKPDPNDPAVVAARMAKDIEKLDIPDDQKAMIAAILKAKNAAQPVSV
jgi:hypothetical protein